MEKQILEDLAKERALHLGGYRTIAGLLSVIIAQNQKGAPLTDPESEKAFREGILVLTEKIADALSPLST